MGYGAEFNSADPNRSPAMRADFFCASSSGSMVVRPYRYVLCIAFVANEICGFQGFIERSLTHQ